MKAVAWYGKQDVRVVQAPDPKVLQPTDAVIMVTRSAICGSDLHMYQGYIPTMRPGDILGHETMGIVVDVGGEVEKLTIGDRIVVPFPIACGKCHYCRESMFTLCDNSNPNAHMLEPMYGDSPAGLYGYSHAYGGFAGGQAEYLRVPFADTCHIKVPERLDDEQVLFLSDILPTGWMAAEYCDIQPGDSVAVWGAGPIGLFAMKSAKIMGAGDVFAIDSVKARLALAEKECGAIPLDREELGSSGIQEELRLRTGGRGPDAVIDAVGMEATDGLVGKYHKAKQAVRLEQDRPTALHEAIMACRKGGIVSVPGVYGGLADKFPMGALFAKGLTLRGGQTPVQRYGEELLGRIESGEIDPTFVISHRITLDEAPEAYRHFQLKDEGWVKVVVRP